MNDDGWNDVNRGTAKNPKINRKVCFWFKGSWDWLCFKNGFFVEIYWDSRLVWMFWLLKVTVVDCLCLKETIALACCSENVQLKENEHVWCLLFLCFGRERWVLVFLLKQTADGLVNISGRQKLMPMTSREREDGTCFMCLETCIFTWKHALKWTVRCLRAVNRCLFFIRFVNIFVCKYFRGHDWHLFDIF